MEQEYDNRNKEINISSMKKGEISKMLEGMIMPVLYNDACLVDVSAIHIHLKPVADQDR